LWTVLFALLSLLQHVHTPSLSLALVTIAVPPHQ
jgi:hypothetical protein